MVKTSLRFCILLLILEIAYTAIAIARAPRWDAFLIGDCPYYAATAESLVHDGDWDLRNQLPGNLKDHEGFFALAKDGRIVPKHSVLLPILAIPFYVVLGKAGFLLFNLVQLFALIYGLMLLAGNGLAARWLALAGYLSTPFLAYTFNFSPDLLGAALVVGSFVAIRERRPWLGGLLAGLAVWAKIYLALVLLPILIILLPQGWKATLAAGGAALLGMLPMVAIHTHLFGAPWITGYDRDARLAGTGFVITEHYSRFNQPFLTGLKNLLSDDRIGLLKTAPLWFLWPLGVVLAWRSATRSARRVMIALMLASAFNIIFFARYDEWHASEFGNRFLFPALALGLALQSPLWRWMIERRQPV